MPGILTRTNRRAAAKFRYDRISSPATSARVPLRSHRILVINPRSQGWTVPTTALALVLIALATLVGGGMTTWHYWNVEQRAAQAEQQTAWQRHMDWWKVEMQRADAERQHHSVLTDRGGKRTQQNPQSDRSSAGIILLTGPNAAAE